MPIEASLYCLAVDMEPYVITCHSSGRIVLVQLPGLPSLSSLEQARRNFVHVVGH